MALKLSFDGKIVYIRKTPRYLQELEAYLNSLGAIQTVPSKSPRTIQDLIGAT